MAAYAVIARVDRVQPHLAGRADRGLKRPTVGALAEPEAIDLVGRPLDAIAAERWVRIREAWTQTTFFLFDPNSWR
jgi:hypothetical protein